VYDAMNIHASNVIVDHVSAVFATDETISMDEFANNVTVQYSNISQGQNYPQADAENPGVYTGHALGSLIQPGSNATISVLHNLYADLKGRLPRVGTEASKLTIPGTGSINDFRNNVFYNWLSTAGTGASAQPSSNNFVGNFYLAGPGGDDASGTAIVTTTGGTSIFNGSNGPTNVFQTGNLKDTNKDGDANDGVALTSSDFSSSSIKATAFTATPYYGITDTATAAYNRVLNYAGADWWNRNSIDTRIINEVRTGTGKITAFDDPNNGTEWNALLNLRSTTNGGIGATGALTRAANYDTDGDGMPDAWEKVHGLNPSVADNNADYDSNGYTNLEEYLNELAAWPAPQAVVFKAAGGNYAQSANWNSSGTATDMRWQPSRYDEAQINAGVCTVNSVGQHAGTLKIATAAGNIAELDVTAGWLKADTAVQIGGTATSQGTLKLSGGELSTTALSKTGANSSFVFTGGKLHAGVVNFDLTNQGGTIAPGDPIGGFDSTGLYVAGNGQSTGGTPPGGSGLLGSTPQAAIGRTEIAGKLTMQSGTIEIEISSLASFDKLVVDNQFTAGGTLQILFTGDTPFANGQSFDILDWNSITGTFASVQLPALPSSLAWNISSLYSNGTISVVPEPSAAMLMGLALAGFLAYAVRLHSVGRFRQTAIAD
jgi:hypothetical protein